MMETEETDNDSDTKPARGTWTGKLDFLLSCLSYAVGLGNLWRFPYLCYRNGGGAFLIPYIVMLAVAGIPLFFLELSFGQFASLGVVHVWKVSPLFQGIGYGMFLVSLFIGIYYNMIIAWTLFYLFASMRSTLPWASCDNEWNTPACSLSNLAAQKNCTNHSGVLYNGTCYTEQLHGLSTFNHISNLSEAQEDTKKMPSDEYFHNFVLDISEGFHDMGEIRWQLALCLLLAWALVAGCLAKGIKSQGKVVYFTASFPYIVLIVLLIRGLTLPGSVNGVIYYLTPQWHRLLTAKVWGDAAVQIFFSLSPCWGGLITLASYNKFNNNCLRDSIVVAIGNCFTSVFAGFVLFSIIGFMAHELDTDISEVATQGAGLAFIVYPEVVTRLPLSPLWAILFFLMLITLGLGTQFSIVTTIHTCILDSFPNVLRKGRRPTLVIVCICAVMFLLGLSCASEGGMFMLQLMDNYSGTYSVLILGFTETVVLVYVYGYENFSHDIELMLSKPLHPLWKWMWKYITPPVLVGIMTFTWIDFKPSNYDDYKFPVWADILGWLMSLSTILPIPMFAIYKVYTLDIKMSIWEVCKYYFLIFRPSTFSFRPKNGAF
ncbi:unnamed protein product [Owenia fusiformis]|uniref:Transporter n=1 Tax=Owenia fusiformis TaxID=6347 RepID=A0A8S4PWA3_OWEFU|nr:unnamed protein product [Owenia fusiformis]